MASNRFKGNCWVVTFMSYLQYPCLLYHHVFTTFGLKNEFAEINLVAHGHVHSCSSSDASAQIVTFYQSLQVTAVFQFIIVHTEGSGGFPYILTLMGLCTSVF